MNYQHAPRRAPLLMLFLAALAAASVILSLSCGGDDSGGSSSGAQAAAASKPTARPGASKNETWAAGLCVAVSGFESDLQGLSSAVVFSPADDAQKVKDTLVKFLQDAQKRSVKLKSDVNALGDPDGKDGKQIQAAMVAASGKAVTVFDKAVKDAQALDTKDPARLKSDITALGTSIEDASNDISGAFEQIDKDYDTVELTKAAGSVPECKGIF